MAQNKKKIFLSEREKVGGEKGVCGGVWECGKPERFSIISMPRSRGKGRGGFLFKHPKGALFGSPFPPILSRQVSLRGGMYAEGLQRLL